MAHLRAKTKVHTVLIREILFADDAALPTHTKHDLQKLFSQFNHARNEFGLTINMKKKKKHRSISINDVVLDVTNHFT